jgi:hypothetical protein
LADIISGGEFHNLIFKMLNNYYEFIYIWFPNLYSIKQ